MIIAKLINNNQIESTWMEDADPLLEQWLQNGWRPLIETALLTQVGDFEQIVHEYAEIEGAVVQRSVVKADYQAEIEWNKQQLNDMDWKTIRNTMAEKAGADLPISWAEIYEQTQIFRDRINQLEATIASQNLEQ